MCQKLNSVYFRSPKCTLPPVYVVFNKISFSLIFTHCGRTAHARLFLFFPSLIIYRMIYTNASKPKNNRKIVPYIVINTFLPFAGVRRPRALGVRKINLCNGEEILLRLFVTHISVTSLKPVVKGALCSKKHIFAHFGRTARAKRFSPIRRSYGGQGGSNEVSHTRIHPHTAERMSTLRYLYIV